ncbi:signal peptidase II [Lachnospiraceae bacterium]|nr:signal peptidase II [Lachnospiraceae bacterium]
MKKPHNILFFILDVILMGALVWFDQFTKQLAVSNLMGKAPVQIIPGYLVLEYLENRGAAFGMLQNQKIFFVTIGTVFIAVMMVSLFLIPASKKYHILRFFLCLMTAGAAGNMIDRVNLEYVVDFIYVICINFPIFNVADIYVTVSAAALVILFLFVYKDEDLNLKKARKGKIHSSFLTDENQDDKDPKSKK